MKGRIARAPLLAQRRDVEPGAHAPEVVHAVEHRPGHERRDRARRARRRPRSASPPPRPRRRTSASTGRPTPASIIRPMRRPRDVALEPLPVDRSAPAGSSRRASSGCASTPIISAASATVRVIGPATRPAYGGSIGIAAEARLQGEDAAPAGRQAHRAADVGADVERPVAGGDAGGRARAAAARVPAQVPRVAGQRRGSSTVPTTASRSRASSSCRGSPRRPRAGAPPAAHRAAPARARSPPCRAAPACPAVAMFSLIIAGTPSSAPTFSPALA